MSYSFYCKYMYFSHAAYYRWTIRLQANFTCLNVAFCEIKNNNTPFQVLAQVPLPKKGWYSGWYSQQIHYMDRAFLNAGDSFIISINTLHQPSAAACADENQQTKFKRKGHDSYFSSGGWPSAKKRSFLSTAESCTRWCLHSVSPLLKFLISLFPISSLFHSALSLLN